MSEMAADGLHQTYASGWRDTLLRQTYSCFQTKTTASQGSGVRTGHKGAL